MAASRVSSRLRLLPLALALAVFAFALAIGPWGVSRARGVPPPTGTWQLDGSLAGYQGVDLVFSSGSYLGLGVTWRPVTSGQGYFVLQLYDGSSADKDPGYQLIRQGGT